MTGKDELTTRAQIAAMAVTVAVIAYLVSRPVGGWRWERRGSRET